MVPIASPSEPPDQPGQTVSITGTNSAFQTTLEVTNGAALVYTFTQRLLGSLGGSGIDSHALTCCLKIGSRLNWSVQGRNRFYEAKDKLVSVSSWSKSLLFGFNSVGPLWDILALDEGTRFAALTACLVETYTPNTVAQIYLYLLELFRGRNQGNPFVEHIKLPAHPRMSSVVKHFAGMMSASSFATEVEEAMSLDEHGCITGGIQVRGKKRRDPTSRMIASPYTIAEALYELLELSMDDASTRQVVFVGCSDALNLAVVGRYLLDLSMSVYKKEGDSLKQVYPSSPNVSTQPRVVVIYSEDQPKDIGLSLAKARIVYLPQISGVVKDNIVSNPDIICSGRCRWDRLLSKTFPDSFKQLVGPLHIHFASAIGCAASIFQGLMGGDTGVTHEWRLDCQGYFESSFGAGYIHFATERFPELQKLFQKNESYIWQQSRLSYAEAILEFERALSQISSSCNCKTCSMTGKPNPKGYTNILPISDKSKEWYCLTALTTTIIRLIRVLSGTDLPDPTLYPKRAGVEWFYNQQKLRHQRQRQKAHTHNNVQSEYFVERIMDRNPRGDKYAIEFSPLTIAAILFSGEQRETDIRQYTSAVTSHGICAYYRILIDFSRQSHIAARVQVIPGCIEHKGTLYEAIYDFGFDPFKDLNTAKRNQARPTICVPERTRALVEQCSTKPLQLALREYLGGTFVPVLEVGFSANMKDDTGVLEWFGPARIVQNITRSTGLARCDPSRCGKFSDTSDELDETIQEVLPSGSPTTEAYTILKYRDAEVAIFRGDKATAMIAACGCWLPLMLTSGDCLKCALLTGLDNSWRTFAIVCPEETYINNVNQKLLFLEL
ncbi:hypothetical protein GGS24DRAFT_474657 [Hypoxylon argillaceum]|nr:hypothetical protein GGS24DRAFT_474657 [Hypoxylon argillaceum]